MTYLNLFCSSYFGKQIWPSSFTSLLNVVSYLSLGQFSYNTFKSYISYYWKLHCFPEATQLFLLFISRTNLHIDARKLNTLNILTTMVQTLPIICHSYFESILFKTILVTALENLWEWGSSSTIFRTKAKLMGGMSAQYLLTPLLEVPKLCIMDVPRE